MKPVFLIAIAAASIIASAGCQLGSPDPRTQITQEYAAADAAFAKGDVNTEFANYSPDYLAVDAGNHQLSLAYSKQMMQIMVTRGPQMGLTFTNRTHTISDFQMQPGNNAAIVTANEALTLNHAGKPLQINAQCRDYWIKSPDGKTWLLKQQRVINTTRPAS